MDTNQESGVSLQDVADLLEEEQVTDESGEQEGAEEIAQSDDSETPEDQPEEGDDAEEVEFEGKAYKVPKELKNALLRQADYTQKTQEVAEQRRAIEERARTFDEQQKLFSQSFEKRVEVREIQNRLSQFEAIDWQGLVRDDPARATELNIAYQQLQRELGKKAAEVQQIEGQAQQLTEQSRQQKLRTESAELLKHIPDFKKHETKVVEAAKHFGYTDAELHAISVLNPDSRALRVLHAASQWLALQEAKPKAMQKVAEAPKVVKPQAVQPKPRTNQAAVQRLQKHGRIEDLASLL